MLEKRIFSLMDSLRGEGIYEYSLPIIKGFMVIKTYSIRYEKNIPCNERMWDKLKRLEINEEEILRTADVLENKISLLRGVLSQYCFNGIQTINKNDVLRTVFENIDEVIGNEEKIVSKINKVLNEYQVKNFIGNIYSSDSINYLLPRIIDVKNNSNFLDICAGVGSFSIDTRDYLKEQGIKDIDINFSACELSTHIINEMKLNMFFNNIEKLNIKQCDVLKELPENEDGQVIKYDNIISDPPFSLKWDSSEARFDKYKRYKYGIPSIASADWAFIQTAIACLNEKGKAALIVSKGALVREQDKEIREGIIEDDLIEAVISLPSSLYYGTGIPVEILVLNKSKDVHKKGKILFINASEEYEKENRNQNYLNQKQKDKIIEVFKAGMEIDKYSKLVDVDTIRTYKYSLNTKEYIEYEALKGQLKNSIELGTIAETLRGVSMSKNDLEELKDEHGYYYLNVKDIQEGKINYDDAYKIELKKSIWQKKYCIKEGDIIITSKGSAFKSAIVTNEYKKAIISSNLMIIRVNNDKCNSIVLNKYLNSKFGKQMIESIFTGSTMKVISPTKLNSLAIPNYENKILKELSKLIVDNETSYVRTITKAKEIYDDNNNKINSIMGISQ
ncbi:hypothetical protein DV092_10245 [Clostridium botulinum]|uniref:N-6 DNA methylase n=1 Tax=Clostridium sp. ZBS20 TaxID=2949966 RepID=UPI00207A5729|nr:N-6 DNA methylase [Clostridium sp. ZBS20]MBN1052412.1 hypothetical protein [Clostridium botulinum]